jgi:hypothetical protein
MRSNSPPHRTIAIDCHETAELPQRKGVNYPSKNLLAKKESGSVPRLVQIQLVPAITGSRLSGMGASVGA